MTVPAVKYATLKKIYEGQYSVTEDAVTGIAIHVWCEGFDESYPKLGKVPRNWDAFNKVARECLRTLVKDEIIPALSTKE